jgi:phosphate/sulfate permease
MTGAINFLWWTTMHAIVAWLIVGPIFAAALYFILVPIVARLAPPISK